MSKWEFLCDSKNLITNISIHSKHHPKATVIKMKSLHYQGRTTVSKRKVFITSDVAGSYQFWWGSFDLWLWKHFTAVLELSSRITHSGQSPWQMCASSKETAKSLASEVLPLVRAAPLSQQLHINRPAYPSCAAACLAMSPLRMPQSCHEERSPYESRHPTSFCYQDSWDHGLMPLLWLIQNTRNPQKWRTLSENT